MILMKYILQVIFPCVYEISIAVNVCIHQLLCLVSLFYSISTFVGYLMPKPSFDKNSSGTI